MFLLQIRIDRQKINRVYTYKTFLFLTDGGRIIKLVFVLGKQVAHEYFEKHVSTKKMFPTRDLMLKNPSEAVKFFFYSYPWRWRTRVTLKFSIGIIFIVYA